MTFKPRQGDIFLNKYEIVSLVGEGAFGSVYRARDIKLDRIVAIKFINVVNDVLDRFNDELSAIKGLDHPNIVRLYDFDILNNGMPCMVMEFINGREVGDVLCSDGPFSLSRICEVALQVLDALVETHKHGIVHCDLKPENIMLSSIGARADVVKLIDFGVASILSNTSGDAKRAKLLVGTPQYMAPEQIRHTEIGPWTDIYAMGLILIELFTGQFVFDAEDPREVLKMQLHTPVTLPQKLAESELGPIIQRAVQKDRTQRYQDTTAFYNDLKEASIAIMAKSRQPSHSRPRSHLDKLNLRSRASQSFFEDFEDFVDPADQTFLKDSISPGSIAASSLLGKPSIHSAVAIKPPAVPKPPVPPPKPAPKPEPPKPEPAKPANAEPAFDSLGFDSLSIALKSGGPLSKSSKPAEPAVPEPEKKDEPVTDPSEDGLPGLLPQRPRTISSVDSFLDTPIQSRSNPNNRPVSRKSAKKETALIAIGIFIVVAAVAVTYFIRTDVIHFQTGSSHAGPRTPRTPRGTASQPDETIRYAAIRATAEGMARNAARSAVVGILPDAHRFTAFRVIGTPVDARLYIAGTLVCARTPCDIRVLHPENVQIEMRGRKASKTFDMNGRDPGQPVFLVLDR